jgi:flagellin
MPSVSNISVGASYAGNYATKARHEMNASIMRLSSGNRTIMGGDAGGGSVAATILARSKSHAVGARNAEDGISAALTAEASLNEMAVVATRLRELGIQYDNASFIATADKAAMDAEATLLFDQLAAIMTETKFNGVSLLGMAGKSFTIGISADTGGTNVALTTSNAIATSAGDYTVALEADVTADIFLADVAESLGNVAAGIASLKSRQAVSYAMASNLEAAAARIMDTDFAAETANLAKFSILNQSAMAMVAQANQAQSAILAVLQ